MNYGTTHGRDWDYFTDAPAGYVHESTIGQAQVSCVRTNDPRSGVLTTWDVLVVGPLWSATFTLHMRGSQYAPGEAVSLAYKRFCGACLDECQHWTWEALVEAAESVASPEEQEVGHE